MQYRSAPDAYMLRLPIGWRDSIKAAAARNRRSMNQEILVALESVAGQAATGEGSKADTPAAAPSNDAALESGASINQDERSV